MEYQVYLRFSFWKSRNVKLAVAKHQSQYYNNLHSGIRWSTNAKKNYNRVTPKWTAYSKKIEVMMIHIERSEKHIKYSNWDFRPLSGFVKNAGWRSTDKRYFQKADCCFWRRDADGHLQLNRSYLSRKKYKFFLRPGSHNNKWENTICQNHQH